MSSDNGPFEPHSVDPARLRAEVEKMFGLSSRPVTKDWDMDVVESITVAGKQVDICTISDEDGPGWCWAYPGKTEPADKKIYSSKSEAKAGAKGWKV